MRVVSWCGGLIIPDCNSSSITAVRSVSKSKIDVVCKGAAVYDYLKAFKYVYCTTRIEISGGGGGGGGGIGGENNTNLVQTPQIIVSPVIDIIFNIISMVQYNKNLST